MGCVCCSLSSFVSILLDALERVSLCTVCAMLTCCLLLTILIVMVMGIGIGYHYCFVQSSVEAMEKAAKSVDSLRSGQPSLGKGEQVMRSVDKSVRGFAHRISRRDAADLQANDTQNFTMHDRRSYNDSFDVFITYKNTNTSTDASL